MQEAERERGGVARRVAAQIRLDILSGEVPIGQRIAGEHQLMSRFGVSRQSVREALRELGTEGLVVSRCGPGGGAFVAEPDLGRMSRLLSSAGTMIAVGEQFSHYEICVAIFEIEAVCCRLAAERADAEAIEKMRSAVDRASKLPPDPKAMFDAYIGFNRALWAAAGNAPLAFIMQAFMRALRGTLPPDQAPEEIAGYRVFLNANHNAILTAIEARDGALAVQHLRDNLEFWLKHPYEATRK